VEKQKDVLDLKSGISRLESSHDYYFGRGTCKKIEQKAKSELQEKKIIRQTILEEIFKSIEIFLALIENEQREDKLERFDLIFRLISITRRDLLTHKQLSSEINEIALKEPQIAKALSALKEKVYLFDEQIDIKQLIEHASFLYSAPHFQENALLKK